MTRQIARYGWRRDQPDHRDRIYNLEEPIQQAHQLPSSVDLEHEMPPVYDQGRLGSCTANAVAAILEHQEMRQGEGTATPSRLFLYYNERVIEGQDPSQDTGAEVRDGIKTAVALGVPPESEWPYSDANPGPFQQPPPQSVYTDAKRYEAVAYKRIVIGQPGAPMRTALASGLPIAFGFSVPAFFERGWDPTRTALPLPGPSDQIIGGHAVVVVGYDYTHKRFPPAFKVRNSWGAEWGNAGHFWMDARWFDPFRGLADDLWIVSQVSQ